MIRVLNILYIGFQFLIYEVHYLLDIFGKWFLWSLIMTFNIENFKNSYCLVANQTNWQGHWAYLCTLLSGFTFFFIVCGRIIFIWGPYPVRGPLFADHWHRRYKRSHRGHFLCTCTWHDILLVVVII